MGCSSCYDNAGTITPVGRVEPLYRWWRGQDLNLRPSGYEPDELPDCSTPRRSNSVILPSLFAVAARRSGRNCRDDDATTMTWGTAADARWVPQVPSRTGVAVRQRLLSRYIVLGIKLMGLCVETTS